MFSYCRGCGKELPDVVSTRDGLCSARSDSCYARFNRYAIRWGINPSDTLGFHDPEWNAYIDQWLEKGQPDV